MIFHTVNSLSGLSHFMHSEMIERRREGVRGTDFYRCAPTKQILNRLSRACVTFSGVDRSGVVGCRIIHFNDNDPRSSRRDTGHDYNT